MPGIGDQVFRPQEPQSAYNGGIGDLTLDLTSAALDPTHPIAVHLGVGDVKVIVPMGTPVNVVSHIGIGKLTVCDDQVQDGFGINQTYDSAAQSRQSPLRLRIDDGIGDVKVIDCLKEHA
jgi:predicted membrane protein